MAVIRKGALSFKCGNFAKRYPDHEANDILREAEGLIEELESELEEVRAARQPVGAMSAEASQVARGMVAHCIEHRLCMGMDEGFSSFDPDVEHHFVRELRGFADGAAPPAQGIDLGQPNEPGRTLYVDLDGVMADFDGAFPAVFGLDHRSLADDEMWGHINGHPSFFRDLPPMSGAVEFFRSVERLNPVILTACPKSNYAHVAAQKRAWVREHLSQTCLVLPVLGGRHKPLFMHQPGDVLIDDFGKNCAAWTEAGGIAIKHEGDWAATRQALALIDSQPTLANVTPPRDLRTQLGEVG